MAVWRRRHVGDDVVEEILLSCGSGGCRDRTKERQIYRDAEVDGKVRMVSR